MSDVLWRWPELCAAVGAPEANGPAISGISIDSRTVRPGELFVALSGNPGSRFQTATPGTHDGHDFIAQAEAAGAAGVLVRRGTRTNIPAIEVSDTLDGLWAIGKAARARMQGRVAAITGSAGKTTARQWLEQILAAQARTHASTGSFNNHWGVPLSLARMPRDSEFGLFEVGTNHAGEIAPLAELVAPDVAIVLNVLPAHIGNFAGLEELRREKLSIESGLSTDGTLIVPVDLDLWGVRTKSVMTFGQSPAADIFGEAQYRRGGASVAITFRGRSLEYQLTLPGEHRVLTSLAAFATIAALDADVDAALPAFETLTVPRGRGNPLAVGSCVVIDDSYNANPVSMRYALEALAAEEGQRIAILGEMRELGDNARVLHAEIESACRELDGVITVGDGFGQWGTSLGERHWAHAGSCTEIDLPSLVDRLGGTNTTVLVKGANKVFWVNGFVDSLIAALERHN